MIRKEYIVAVAIAVFIIAVGIGFFESRKGTVPRAPVEETPSVSKDAETTAIENVMEAREETSAPVTTDEQQEGQNGPTLQPGRSPSESSLEIPTE